MGSTTFELQAVEFLSRFKYLIRRNFRAYKFSRTCSAQKFEIFAHIDFRAPLHFLIACYMAIEVKNRDKFCKNLVRKYFRARNCKNLVLISTNKVFANLGPAIRDILEKNKKI